ncbi:hypothetical protein D3C77_545520 [compost metagenome]
MRSAHNREERSKPLRMIHTKVPPNTRAVGIARIEKRLDSHEIRKIANVLRPHIIPGLPQILMNWRGGGISPYLDVEYMKTLLCKINRVMQFIVCVLLCLN